MKKVIVSLAAVSLIMLAGCQQRTFIYKGTQYQEEDLQEKIADELEVENTDLDIEVDIYTETDD